MNRVGLQILIAGWKREYCLNCIRFIGCFFEFKLNTVALSLGVLLPSFCFSQSINLVKVCSLPQSVKESSGLTISNRNSFWTHNDSGGKPELYNFDSLGTLLRILHIKNAANIDWEDVAQDDDDNFYIGDFGNNDNNRKDLIIYKIASFSQLTGDSAVAEKIHFNYSDQLAFPPGSGNRNFDVEAFFAFNNQLFLFTKNRSSNGSGFTKLYVIPAQAGTHTAILTDSFFTGVSPSRFTQITAADISPDKTKIALLCNDALLVFTNFSGTDFFGGSMKRYFLQPSSQKEGVCFLSESEVFITDEVANGAGGVMSYLNLDYMLSVQPQLGFEQTLVYKNFDEVFFCLRSLKTGVYEIAIYDATGRLIEQKKISWQGGSEDVFSLSAKHNDTFIAVVTDGASRLIFSQKFIR